MEKPSYYSVMPASVRYDETLCPQAKLLYGEITCLANKYGYCTASNAHFAELYDKSKRTAETWIRQLAQAGHIRTEVLRDANGEVQERRIWLAEKVHTPPREIAETSPQNCVDPPREIAGDYIRKNNTRANNTPIVPKGDAPKLNAKEVAKLYITYCPHLTGFVKLSQGRERAVQKLAKAGITMDQIAQAFARADASDFLRGQGQRGWRASFDWLVREDNLLKVLEGKYDNPEPPATPPGGKLIEEDWVDA